MAYAGSEPEHAQHQRDHAGRELELARHKPAGRRSREPAKRARRVEFTLTDEEFGELAAAAARAGLSRGAYAAQSALAAARGASTPAGAPVREALAELIRCAGLVRRAGVNLNQAVAKLNATGQRSGDQAQGIQNTTRTATLPPRNAAGTSWPAYSPPPAPLAAPNSDPTNWP